MQINSNISSDHWENNVKVNQIFKLQIINADIFDKFIVQDWHSFCANVS